MTDLERNTSTSSITDEFKAEGFRVYEVSRTLTTTHTHGRRDYYKMVLLTGDLEIRYGDYTVEASGSNLILVNPHVFHSVTHRLATNRGYACVFTESFFSTLGRSDLLNNSPLYRSTGSLVIQLDKPKLAYVTSLFDRMLTIWKQSYQYKSQLLKSCIELILHEALILQPESSLLRDINGSTRMTYLFKDLLEAQFPIESISQTLTLRTAQDFAQALSVHVNYLNRSVKSVTGFPTSVHIANRIATEAKAILLHTDWSIADIAYSLGFEYPTYFNNYFKRVTGVTPNSVRKIKV